MSENRIPIACSLEPGEMSDQLEAWRTLAQECLQANAVSPTSFRALFDVQSLARVTAVADAERKCCSFLSIEVSEDPQGVRLEVSSDQEDAKPIVEALLAAVTAGTRPPAAACEECGYRWDQSPAKHPLPTGDFSRADGRPVGLLTGGFPGTTGPPDSPTMVRS